MVLRAKSSVGEIIGLPLSLSSKLAARRLLTEQDTGSQLDAPWGWSMLTKCAIKDSSSSNNS
jgi:hypothetical protein